MSQSPITPLHFEKYAFEIFETKDRDPFGNRLYALSFNHKRQTSNRTWHMAMGEISVLITLLERIRDAAGYEHQDIEIANG